MIIEREYMGLAMGVKEWCDKCKTEKGYHNDCPNSSMPNDKHIEDEITVIRRGD